MTPYIFNIQDLSLYKALPEELERRPGTRIVLAQVNGQIVKVLEAIEGTEMFYATNFSSPPLSEEPQVFRRKHLRAVHLTPLTRENAHTAKQVLQNIRSYQGVRHFRYDPPTWPGQNGIGWLDADESDWIPCYDFRGWSIVQF